MASRRRKPRTIVVGGGNPFTIAVAPVEQAVQVASRNFSRNLANHLAGRVRQVLIAQEEASNWAPLSPEYARYKEREGLDDRILIATRFYLHRIRARLDETGDGYVVGLPRQQIPGQQDSLTYEQLSIWLEFGTRNADGSFKMPPRPHFQPVFTAFAHAIGPHTRALSENVLETVKTNLDSLLRRNAMTRRSIKVRAKS